VWSQVRTFDADEIAHLLSKPEFDVPVTGESRNRRSMYRAEEKRNDLMQAEHADVADFIRKCNLTMRLFVPATEEEKLRCYELIVRTNQLNMSGKKYTPEEFGEVLARPGHKNFAFSCGDDFGEYGIVGFGQYRVDGERLVFTEFAMSCRVAGKFVESALFVHLLDAAHCKTGIFHVHKTKKNILLRNTLKQIGFRSDAEDSDSVSYTFGADLLNSGIVTLR
jgi:FkbH-like protein